ncbi:Hypothetical protein MVR_LOCUS174 [uncultured virus]|nr:Hypothetical protein MVR_LOCUS174 [uncultured virus]
MLVASAPATLIAFKDADTHTFNPRAFLIISNLCKDARVHSTLGLTFADLMDYIWTLMATSDQLTELISVFSQHMEHPVYMSIENLFRHAIIPFCYPKSELSPNRLTHSPLYTLDQAVRSSSTDSDNTASLCISAFKAAFYYRTGLANAAAASDHARICYTTDPDLFFMYENEGPPIEYYTTNRFAEI